MRVIVIVRKLHGKMRDPWRSQRAAGRRLQYCWAPVHCGF